MRVNPKIKHIFSKAAGIPLVGKFIQLPYPFALLCCRLAVFIFGKNIKLILKGSYGRENFPYYKSDLDIYYVGTGKTNCEDV